MKLGYTEFSFGYAFTDNLLRCSVTGPSGAPVFPNLVQEAQLGYDVKVDLPGQPLYFQFKLPELMVMSSAAEISKYALDGIVVPFYRMSLTRTSVSDQHANLIELEKESPHSVFYVSPALKSINALNEAYLSASAHRRCAFFSPMNLGPLPDNEQHAVAYNTTMDKAWLRSEPHQVPILQFTDIERHLSDSFNMPRYKTFREAAGNTLEHILALVPQQVRAAEHAVREQVRARRSATHTGELLDTETWAVTEDALVSREIARMALGIELVIAQPPN